MSHQYQEMESPVGKLILVAGGGELQAVVFKSIWPKFKPRFGALEETETPVLRRAAQQLREYFGGKRRSFDLPLKLNGTDFENKVWSALAEIPFGQTRTYKEQAASINSPRAVRAVGRANGVNALCLVLPCHRVIGSDGSLTGYAGGLEAKKFLLKLEGAAIER